MEGLEAKYILKAGSVSEPKTYQLDQSNSNRFLVTCRRRGVYQVQAGGLRSPLDQL
jgi:hypothetical protein